MHFLISLIKIFFFVPYRGATFLNSWYNSLMVLGRFPSPIGELHFSIWTYIFNRSRFRGVSVPYRGATFLNQMMENMQFSQKSFRPLSGSYISQYSIECVYTGEYRIVSVPYRGATFLNNNVTRCSGTWVKVSVPYRGATFLNPGRRDQQLICWSCFRPLSGSYISQFSDLSWLYII